MQSLNISIKNPKARKLLEDLADLGLIQIKSQDDFKKEFLDLAADLRKNDSDLSLEEIQKEVDAVRKKS